MTVDASGLRPILGRAVRALGLEGPTNLLSAAWETATLVRQRIPSTPPVEEIVAHRLAHREDQFLWGLEHLIFANPHSPYRPLLQSAGYDLPGVTRLVRAGGLDHALDRLREEGVFVRIQEFKGFAPVVRGGRVYHVHPADFANPLVRGAYPAVSSGSRGPSRRTSVSLEEFVDWARFNAWMVDRCGLQHRDVVFWVTFLGGLTWRISWAIAGHSPIAWFSLNGVGSRETRILTRVGRLVGRKPLPDPIDAPAERVLDVVRFISRANTPRGIVLVTLVSSALRLVLAAEEARIPLGDVAFLVWGEPLTLLKRQQFERRGFRVLPMFAFSEFGPCGWACLAPSAPDDMHVLTDRVAIRPHVRQVGGGDETVDGYLFTSLLPHTRNVLLNVESGDYGGLETRSCGCPLDEAGFRQHIYAVRSFEKLTAEGMTFVGPALIELVEEVLPREFGGDSRHYQLVESEDARGFTRIYLLASPALGKIDEDALRRRVLRELPARHLSRGTGRLVQRVWADAGTIRILRREPLTTASGKVLHLHRDKGELEMPATFDAVPSS